MSNGVPNDEHEQQKNKILAVARELFTQKGFEATTTRQINKQAGISEGLLYYYFPHGKREILDAIIYQGIVERTKFIGLSFGDVNSVKDIEQQMTGFFDQVWQVFKKEENYQSFMITIRERMLLTDDQSKWLLDLMNTILGSLVEFLTKSFQKLSIDTSNVQQIAEIIMSIFQKVIYDELLIKNDRKTSSAVVAGVEEQIHVLLTLVSK